ncbi:hypothetical protein CFN58_01955 [Pseudomonas avellanae]|uniref:Uncharacterized protein n=2 Tax=Pseudomonas syringae group TaxID=136849 RepID=A0A261WNG4_9PSED|nr:hypothetical protein CT122_07830 [Pseudomonas syringae pv. actinidiae]OZI87741.1 hypothetical protein CFN58_01955 [Pseudomonas avellanae]PIN61043.1 hypothetical protein CUB86_13335 [Pseudomonas syringae pv. actinidiae]
MNIYEKKCVGFCLLSIFVLMASASSAHANRGSEEPVGAPNNETSETFLAEAVQENSEPRFTVMLDKLHSVVYRLKINFSHACVLIATRARWILFKISSPLAFQT